ncbi:LysR family transcriptional regulator [Ruegeria marisrubri]|uniref:LysR family transcriptional regulator n=1 Tax=Ruegeria marisrubri TaxID=1685379 RepID=UPI001CD315FB|nr:LysR family transcriptional regulator [Ruegeria marisrubri]MCA0908661.1 LysR family transcriptional regulator [Ruegeria marisrubri]
MSARMPKIASLKLFAQVMQSGTIAKVAEHMNVTPSAASRMLSALERDLELKLFRRERQRLIPTEAAETLLPEAMRALSVMDELPRISDAIREGATKEQLVRILSFPRLAEQILPLAVQRYYDETRSETRINISVDARHNIKRWAASRLFDIALTTVPVVHPGVRGEPIIDFPLCVVLPRDHPLSGECEIPVQALADEPLSLIESGSILRQRIARVFDGAGLVPNVRQESGKVDVSIRVGLAAGSMSINDGIFPKALLGQSFVLRRLKTTQSVPVGFVVPRDREVEGAAAFIMNAIRQEVLTYRNDLDKVLNGD